MEPIPLAFETETPTTAGDEHRERTGGRFIVAFSNRWFPPKVIQIWEGIHEFKRPGLVSEYLLESGLFGSLETGSIRGLPRPEDDKYADRMPLSDPVYAVWGERMAS